MIYIFKGSSCLCVNNELMGRKRKGQLGGSCSKMTEARARVMVAVMKNGEKWLGLKFYSKGGGTKLALLVSG